jgi:Protein of unknown function (DUF2917)
MECYLAQGELIRFDGGKDGATLRCTSGTVWLTCGDGRDYLLFAGKSFVIGTKQVAVVEALNSAECTLAKTYIYSHSVHRPVFSLAACS